MKKIRGQIEKIEDSKATIKYDGSSILIPDSLAEGFKAGDPIVITLATEKEDNMSSDEVAQALLTDILKEG